MAASRCLAVKDLVELVSVSCWAKYIRVAFNLITDLSRSHLQQGIYKHLGMYKARVWVGEREMYLGHYSFPEKAADVYDKTVIHLRGPELARYMINEPVEKYDKILDQLLTQSTESIIIEFRNFCERW